MGTLIESYRQAALWAEIPIDSRREPHEGRARTRANDAVVAFSQSFWPEEFGDPLEPVRPEMLEVASPLTLVEQETKVALRTGHHEQCEVLTSQERTPETSLQMEPASGENLLDSDRGRYFAHLNDGDVAKSNPQPVPKPLSRHPRNSLVSVPERKVKTGPGPLVALDGAIPGPDGAMEAVADMVQEMMEKGGASAERIRSFVTTFPPSEQWGDPWPRSFQEVTLALGKFAPSASCYMAVMSDVLGGRRRARMQGIWESGAGGSLVLSRVLSNAEWQIVEANSDPA